MILMIRYITAFKAIQLLCNIIEMMYVCTENDTDCIYIQYINRFDPLAYGFL